MLLILDGEHDIFAAGYSTHNRLSSNLGNWDHTARLTLNQPFGRGEQVYGYFSGGPDAEDVLTSDGPRRITGGGLTFALGNGGLSVNLEYTRSDTRPTPAPFTPALHSEFERYSVRLARPLLLDRSRELTVSATLEALEQRDSFPEFEFTLGHDRLRVLRLGAQWRRAWLGGVLTLDGIVSRGLEAWGARKAEDVAASGTGSSRPGADPDFLKLDTTIAFDRGLRRGFQSGTLLRAQRAIGGVLPGSELFSLDGEQGLSTLHSGALAQDGGWTLRQEVTRPAVAGDLFLIPYAFAVIGRASSQLANAASTGGDEAWGLGLRASWRVFNVALEYGAHNSGHGSDDKLFLRGGIEF